MTLSQNSLRAIEILVTSTYPGIGVIYTRARHYRHTYHNMAEASTAKFSFQNSVIMQTSNNKKHFAFLQAGLSIILFAFLHGLFGCLGSNQETDQTSSENSQRISDKKQIDTMIENYLVYVTQNTEKMGLEHDYSSNALTKLMAATSAQAQLAGIDQQKDLEEVQVYAERITNNPYAQTHADDIRKAALLISNILFQIQQTSYPELDSTAANVKTAAEAIDPDVLTLQQKEKVNAFFINTADLLRKMN